MGYPGPPTSPAALHLLSSPRPNSTHCRIHASMVEPAPNSPTVEVVFSPEAIASRLEDLCREIAAANLERLLVVPILTGSFVFSADLLRGLYRAGLAPEVDFLSLASYRQATRSSGRSRPTGGPASRTRR